MGTPHVHVWCLVTEIHPGAGGSRVPAAGHRSLLWEAGFPGLWAKEGDSELSTGPLLVLLEAPSRATHHGAWYITNLRGTRAS